MTESWSPEGVVLAKFDYVQVEHSRGHLVVTDGWLTNYITIYDDGRWASEMEITNSEVISWINDYIFKSTTRRCYGRPSKERVDGQRQPR